MGIITHREMLGRSGYFSGRVSLPSLKPLQDVALGVVRRKPDGRVRGLLRIRHNPCHHRVIPDVGGYNPCVLLIV